MAMDEITRAVYAESSIDIATMPKEFKRAEAYDHPRIGNRTHEVVVDGKTFDFPTTIADDNKDVYRYAWLDLEGKALTEHHGYAFVTRKSPAARNKDGEMIPDRYFNGRDHIQKGTLTYCFCLEEYGRQVKQTSNDYCTERLASFAGEAMSAEVNHNGLDMGGVRTKTHTTESVEDILSNNLPIGRGKKG